MYQAILSCFYNCNAQATVSNFICFPLAIREFAFREGQICWTIEFINSANATSLRRYVKTIEEKNSGLLAV